MYQFNKRVIAGVAVVAGIAAWMTHRATVAQAPPPVFSNFESSQTNPVKLSPDGTRLFAANTANSSLSVFDVTTEHSPKLVAEIPVGLEPVSVNPLSNDEVWVVNEAGNSVSVVSVKKGTVLYTVNLQSLSTPELPLSEPTDVVFANGQAYISVSRANAIVVVDSQSLKHIATIPVFGGNPRAMAVSPDGKTVYAAFALSGNATTIIPSKFAPVPAPPTNPALPPAPQVGLIVSATDPNWKSYINFTMPDNDVVAINVGATPTVSKYYSGVGTVNLGLAVNPVSGDLFVANTDALNLTHYETNLCGHYVNNRVTRIQVAGGQVTPFDLNPNINYGCTPNSADLATALAQPTGVVFDPSGSFMYVAAFGTDRVAKVDTSGNVISFVEVAQSSGAGSSVDPAHKRGPRGLALSKSSQVLYSLNRISNTLSVISTPSNAVVGEVAVGRDLTPADVKAGRGFLYDAKLSGTGTASCAGCHIDGDMDHLSWDLGDPAGNMGSTVQNGVEIFFHPMKGPMTTQTLRGLQNLTPYHWRGDKVNFAGFNGAFPALMGGTSISDSDMGTYTTFVNTIQFYPNPYLGPDGSFPASVAGGNPAAGEVDFMTLPLTDGKNTCVSCHTANPGPGTSRLIRVNPDRAGNSQPLKIPQLRNIYQKLLYTKNSGSAIDGFGMNHDGNAYGFPAFFHGAAFKHYNATQKKDMAAYGVCFGTGTAPAVGYAVTLRKNDIARKNTQSAWAMLTAQATAGSIDLIVRGTINGTPHGLLYQPSNSLYLSDSGATYTQAALQTLVEGKDIMTIMGVLPGSGTTSPKGLN